MAFYSEVSLGISLAIPMTIFMRILSAIPFLVFACCLDILSILKFRRYFFFIFSAIDYKIKKKKQNSIKLPLKTCKSSRLYVDPKEIGKKPNGSTKEILESVPKKMFSTEFSYRVS